jgi:hypothetical protein
MIYDRLIKNVYSNNTFKAWIDQLINQTLFQSTLPLTTPLPSTHTHLPQPQPQLQPQQPHEEAKTRLWQTAKGETTITHVSISSFPLNLIHGPFVSNSRIFASRREFNNVVVVGDGGLLNEYICIWACRRWIEIGSIAISKLQCYVTIPSHPVSQMQHLSIHPSIAISQHRSIK